MEFWSHEAVEKMATYLKRPFEEVEAALLRNGWRRDDARFGYELVDAERYHRKRVSLRRKRLTTWPDALD